VDTDETAWLQRKMAEPVLEPSDRGRDDALRLGWSAVTAPVPIASQEIDSDENRQFCALLHKESAHMGRSDAESQEERRREKYRL